MSDTPQQWLLIIFERCGRQLSDGYITTQEYVSKLLDQLANIDGTFPEVAPALWELIPEGARAEFVVAIRAATVPDFRYHAFEIGGSRGLTEEERQFQQVRNGQRVQSWAVEFLRRLDSNSIER